MDERLSSSDEQNPTIRNPPWTRDELILALDLYFRMSPKIGDASHQEVVALSKVLNSLPIHSLRPDAQRFRNPAGVTMKLNNFRRFDPTYGGIGLSHGAKADKEIWEEFVLDQERLHAVAIAIRACASVTDVVSAPLDEEEYASPEGEVLYRYHKFHERDRSLVSKKKEQALRRHGVLRCEACGFVFTEHYGELGAGFIECHHTVPVAQLRPGQLTKLDDLALVCANCHRMLHRPGKVRSIMDLRTAIKSAQTLHDI